MIFSHAAGKGAVMRRFLRTSRRYHLPRITAQITAIAASINQSTDGPFLVERYRAPIPW